MRNAKPTKRRTPSIPPSTPISPRHTSAKARGIAPALKRRWTTIAVVSVTVIALVAGGAVVVASMPARITFNGQALDVGGQKTLGEAMREADANPQPGDLLAIDGSVLEAGGGEPFRATVNGVPATDMDMRLNSGDTVIVEDGASRTESSSTTERTTPFAFETEGDGAVHMLEGVGKEGRERVTTGDISGMQQTDTLQEPVDEVRRNVSPDVGDDKVIALTFDDGPWPETTERILDILADNNAKATFFTVGNRIDGSDEGTRLVKRAAAEGHQICTHSFDHAAGDGQGVNLGYMSPDDQVQEIERGYQAIETATGKQASHVIRTPGGNYGEDVMRAIGGMVDAEIGWDIDSEDWRQPGAKAIQQQIESAWPGSIVLLHDGGGDRSQTVQALKKALPRLKAQGYRFITIDELLAYPVRDDS